MKRNFQRTKSVDAIYGGIATTVTPGEAADYIHEMLEGLHAMAIHPANHKLRSLLWLAILEARRVTDDEPLSSRMTSGDTGVGKAIAERWQKISAK